MMKDSSASPTAYRASARLAARWRPHAGVGQARPAGREGNGATALGGSGRRKAVIHDLLGELISEVLVPIVLAIAVIILTLPVYYILKKTSRRKTTFREDLL